MHYDPFESCVLKILVASCFRKLLSLLAFSPFFSVSYGSFVYVKVAKSRLHDHDVFRKVSTSQSNMLVCSSLAQIGKPGPKPLLPWLLLLCLQLIRTPLGKGRDISNTCSKWLTNKKDLAFGGLA